MSAIVANVVLQAARHARQGLRLKSIKLRAPVGSCIMVWCMMSHTLISRGMCLPLKAGAAITLHR